MSRFLQAGIIENGKHYKLELGVLQGGVSSPIYDNVYLHYVLDLWFEKAVKKHINGLKEIWESLNQRITGYFQYYAVNDNLRSLKLFMYQLERIIFKCINRRSDKKSISSIP